MDKIWRRFLDWLWQRSVICEIEAAFEEEFKEYQPPVESTRHHTWDDTRN